MQSNVKVTCKLGLLCNRDKISQTELARRISASRQQVNKWCKNHDIPSIGYVVRIHKVTGWTLDEMFSEEE